MNHMLLLPLVGAVVFAGGLLGLLLQVAILCVVIWAIIQLLAWAGYPIGSLPAPVRIILTALVLILIIVLLFRLFGAIV